MNKKDLFIDYYKEWLKIYKEGAIREATMSKYRQTLVWLEKLIPNVEVNEINRIVYQQLINDYALVHERQTTMDFHHQLKAAVTDAIDEGLLEKDPTRKVIIKGKSPRDKKTKFLSRYELQKLLTTLELKDKISNDWLILLIAKTGLRFSEALAITPSDFDFAHQTLSITKTWDYKTGTGFLPTKNMSSIRKVSLDWQTVIQFFALVKDLSLDIPIFIGKKERIFNSTINDFLQRHCEKADIPVITIHGLRHTHASLLLYSGVSIGSVAQRLGHSNMVTTQKTYLHIIHEMENKDTDLIMRSLSSLNQ